MLTYFLFFFYLFFGTLLLHFIIRRKIFPFTIYHTAAVVFFRIFMGCLYGWVFLHYYGGDDTWNFFDESKEQTDILLTHPSLFFREFLPGFAYHIAGNHIWEAFRFYVYNFERWFMIRGLAILNLFSGKNYFIDVILFDMLTIPGPLLLFKMLSAKFPLRSGSFFLIVFFVPSIIFWCSGIRAEAILLLSMVLILYNGNAYALKPGLVKILFILAGCCGLLLLRYQFLLIFIPAFAACQVSLQKKLITPVIYNRIYACLMIIFIASLFLRPAFQLSRPLIETQRKFFLLHGNTRYGLDSLEPGPVSIVKGLPQAFANSTLRPFPWEGKNLLQSVSSVEVLMLLAGLLFFMLDPRRKEQVSHPIYWFFLYYGICQFITIGYTVPFPGAIVRYRTIPFLFLLLFLYSGHPLLQQKLRYWIFKIH
jgi:hypothetical protein